MTEELRKALLGLGLPDTQRAIQMVLSATKDGAVPRRYASVGELSPYSTGLMLAVLCRRPDPARGEFVDQIRTRLSAAIDVHFPSPVGNRVNDLAQVPVVGTCRVLLGLAAAGLEMVGSLSNALSWLLAQQNQDGGFGLVGGDRSRIFATTAVAELLLSLRGHESVLKRIADFVMDSYDESTQSWGLIWGKDAPPERGATRSSSAQALEAWAYLKRAAVLSGKRAKDFDTTIEQIQHQIAEALPLSGGFENASFELAKLRPIPLFHFTLLHCLKALVWNGMLPGERRIFDGLRMLQRLQDDSGAFRYGTHGEPQVWATVDAISFLDIVEGTIAAQPEAFMAAIMSHMTVSTSASDEQREQTRESFLQDCRSYCYQQLVPELRLHNVAFHTEGCLLVGQAGRLIGKRVHVIAEYLSATTHEDINRWIVEAMKLNARLIVLTNRRLTIEQYREIWKHNEGAKNRVEPRTI